MWTANLFLYTDMSVYLQEPHPKRRAGQSFSNCGLKITYIVWEWTSSLSGSVNRRINREWQRFSLSNMQRKKESKRIEMIIKKVNEFKLTVVHFARPNPTQICAYAWIYRWTKELWKIRTPGLQAAGQPDRWVSGPRGRRGSWAAGRGPLGHGPCFSKTPPKWRLQSTQSSTKVHETFRQITRKLWPTKTWDLDKLFTY